MPRPDRVSVPAGLPSRFAETPLAADAGTPHLPQPMRSVPQILSLAALGSTARDLDPLMDRAFGPGRHAKAASGLRDGARLVPQLSHVARHDGTGDLIGACLLWQVASSMGGTALLLGPIAVEPQLQGGGLGRALCRACLSAVDAADAGTVVLVGDPGFFGPFGFVPVPSGTVRFDWPADPARTLWRPGSGARPAGKLLWISQRHSGSETVK